MGLGAAGRGRRQQIAEGALAVRSSLAIIDVSVVIDLHEAVPSGPEHVLLKVLDRHARQVGRRRRSERFYQRYLSVARRAFERVAQELHRPRERVLEDGGQGRTVVLEHLVKCVGST